MNCFKCLASGSPPFWTFLSNGSTLCLDRVSAAGESVYNFFSDIHQCGPALIAIRGDDDVGIIVGSSIAAAVGIVVAAGLEFYFWKKYHPQPPPAEDNNNARLNIFGFANPNYGFNNPNLPPNQLVINPEPENEEFPQLIPIGQPQLDPIEHPQDANLPVFGPDPDPEIIGHSAYGRPLRKVRRYPE